jgi:hypothetical protein
VHERMRHEVHRHGFTIQDVQSSRLAARGSRLAARSSE